MRILSYFSCFVNPFLNLYYTYLQISYMSIMLMYAKGFNTRQNKGNGWIVDAGHLLVLGLTDLLLERIQQRIAGGCHHF